MLRLRKKILRIKMIWVWGIPCVAWKLICCGDKDRRSLWVRLRRTWWKSKSLRSGWSWSVHRSNDRDIEAVVYVGCGSCGTDVVKGMDGVATGVMGCFEEEDDHS